MMSFVRLSSAWQCFPERCLLIKTSISKWLKLTYLLIFNHHLFFFACFRPNAFKWDQVLRLSPVERLDQAFTVAKDQLAIERLLDPEGNFAFKQFITTLSQCILAVLYQFTSPQQLSYGNMTIQSFLKPFTCRFVSLFRLSIYSFYDNVEQRPCFSLMHINPLYTKLLPLRFKCLSSPKCK